MEPRAVRIHCMSVMNENLSSSHPADGCSIAIVGGGPSSAYLLHAFLRAAKPCRITVFEAGAVAGPGIPFSADHNGAHLLANIAGFELPPLCETLNQWAMRQSDRRQKELGIAGLAEDDRAFFPRRALGAFYADQMRLLLERMQGSVTLHTLAAVQDVAAHADGVSVTWRQEGEAHEALFDRVIIASGYGRSDEAHALAGEAAKEVTGQRIAVLGSSLSAIDAAVEVAMRRGRFEGTGDGLRYIPDRPWSIAFLSRNGLLPEADFWIPEDAGELPLFNADAIAPMAQGRDGDLDRIFDLFAQQLAQVDPGYARAIDLPSATPDNFAQRYFARRLSADPFAYARANLIEARQTHARRRASAWRLVLLLAHSAFGSILPALSPRDLERFNAGLKRCFVDNYAAVPHLSVERMLALHDAGVLTVHKIGPIADPDQREFMIAGRAMRFDDLIDARGQPALGLDRLPFPTLRLQLCSQANARRRDWEDGLFPAAGYVLDPDDMALSRVHALCLPFLLQRHPFIQGLTESAAMAQACVGEIGRRMNAAAPSLRQKTLDALAWLEQTTMVFQGDRSVPLIRPQQGM